MDDETLALLPTKKKEFSTRRTLEKIQMHNATAHAIIYGIQQH